MFNLPMILFGQDQTLDSTRQEYIYSYKDYFFVGPVLKKRNLSFEVSSIHDPKAPLVFKPNNSYSLGLAINIFEVGVEASFSVPVDVRTEDTYGASTVSDVQFTAIGKEWFADAYHQKYDGFYNSSQKVQTGQSFPQRSDVITRNFGLSFAYIFNHNRFSLRSAYTFTEAQRVSRGSFLLSYVLSSFTLHADSSIVAPAQWSTWGTGSSFDEVRFTSLGLAPGYSYNFVYKKFFLNTTLAIGPAHYWTRYHLSESDTENDIRINVYSLGRIGLGYNGDRIFAGLTIISQARDLRFEDIKFNNSISTARFVVGFRFLERGILKERAVDHVPRRLR